MMPLAITFLVGLAVVALALALAYLPMKLLVLQIARNVSQFIIDRQRERRHAPRPTPDRRKAAEPQQ